MGDGLVSLSQWLYEKITKLEFVEMAERLLETWLSDEVDHHSECCNIWATSRHRKVPVTNILCGMQCFVAFTGAISTKFLAKVPKLMAYQATMVKCAKT